MIIFIGKITHATAENATRALEKAGDGDALSAAEPGCVHYTHAQDFHDKRVIWLVHVYKTIPDVQAHLDADFYPELKAAVTEGSIAMEVNQYVGMEAFNFL